MRESNFDFYLEKMRAIKIPGKMTQHSEVNSRYGYIYGYI